MGKGDGAVVTGVGLTVAEKWQIAAAVATSVAAIASAVAAWFSRGAARASRDLAHVEAERWEREKREAGRATFLATYESTGGSFAGWSVVVTNMGPADAFDVVAQALRAEEPEEGAIKWKATERERMQPGEAATLDIGLYLGGAPPSYGARVQWRDELGAHDEVLHPNR